MAVVEIGENIVKCLECGEVYEHMVPLFCRVCRTSTKSERIDKPPHVVDKLSKPNRQLIPLETDTKMQNANAFGESREKVSPTQVIERVSWYDGGYGALILPKSDLVEIPDRKSKAVKAKVARIDMFVVGRNIELRLRIAESLFPGVDEEQEDDMADESQDYYKSEFARFSSSTTNYFEFLSEDWVNRMSTQYLLSGGGRDHSSYYDLEFKTHSCFLPANSETSDISETKNKMISITDSTRNNTTRAEEQGVVHRVVSAWQNRIMKKYGFSEDDMSYMISNAKVID